MKIREILNRNRNDFTATMECEYCGRTAKLTSGYDDDFYHEVVIPAMLCKFCGKNRDGEVERIDAGVSPYAF